MPAIFYDGDSAAVQNQWGVWTKGEPREVREDVADRLMADGLFKAAPSHDSRPYESRTKDDLIKLAKDRGLPYSGKSKDELIADLRGE